MPTAPTPTPTVEEARQALITLEGLITREIKAFEEKFTLEVTNVDLERAPGIKGYGGRRYGRVMWARLRSEL